MNNIQKRPSTIELRIMTGTHVLLLVKFERVVFVKRQPTGGHTAYQVRISADVALIVVRRSNSTYQIGSGQQDGVNTWATSRHEQSEQRLQQPLVQLQSNSSHCSSSDTTQPLRTKIDRMDSGRKLHTGHRPGGHGTSYHGPCIESALVKLRRCIDRAGQYDGWHRTSSQRHRVYSCRQFLQSKPNKESCESVTEQGSYVTGSGAKGKVRTCNT